MGQQRPLYFSYAYFPGLFAFVEIIVRLGNQPRVTERGAANHYSVDPGMSQHSFGVFGTVYISVADDRNFDGLFDGGNNVPIRGSRIEVGAAMNGYIGGTAVFAHSGKIDGIDRTGIPAFAKLDADFQRRGIDRAFNDLGSLEHVFHQPRT